MLIIESEETPQNKSGNLKEDAVFLLNDEEQSYNDQQIEKNKVDGGNKKKLSWNVRNGSFWLKKLLIGTLQSFQKYNYMLSD